MEEEEATGGIDDMEEEELLCRWFRFAQLAKGKKFRP